MELEVLRYTNKISSEAHREVSQAPAPVEWGKRCCCVPRELREDEGFPGGL